MAVPRGILLTLTAPVVGGAHLKSPHLEMLPQKAAMTSQGVLPSLRGLWLAMLQALLVD